MCLPRIGHCQKLKKLERLLEDYPEAVGIGEIGIDHTTRCKCSVPNNKEHYREEKIKTQCQFLRLVLPLAKSLGKVIALHVRSKDNDEQSLAALMGYSRADSDLARSAI